MPARACPRCALLSPPTSMVCDCGYAFEQGASGLASARRTAKNVDRSPREVHPFVWVGLLIVAALAGLVYVLLSNLGPFDFSRLSGGHFSVNRPVQQSPHSLEPARG